MEDSSDSYCIISDSEESEAGREYFDDCTEEAVSSKRASYTVISPVKLNHIQV